MSWGLVIWKRGLERGGEVKEGRVGRVGEGRERGEGRVRRSGWGREGSVAG